MSDVDSPVQLSLGVSLKDDATFNNFYVHCSTNRQVVDVLYQIATVKELHPHVIWGATGSGLTHLLQAVCHVAFQHQISAQYIPMRDVIGFSADDICDGLEGIPLVCLDGIDLICGHRSWESALFHLFNKLKDNGHGLIMASHTNPASTPILLADLKSRILGSTVYHVESLTDEAKCKALVMRAQARGMDMPQDVAEYILSRAARDTNHLFYILNRLDDASLREQRKLTIPFVKRFIRL